MVCPENSESVSSPFNASFHFALLVSNHPGDIEHAVLDRGLVIQPVVLLTSLALQEPPQEVILYAGELVEL